jgi:hypothetical protein
MKKLKTITSLGLILALLLLFFGMQIQVSQAALSAVSDTLSRVKVNTTANHTVKFTTATALAAGNTIKVQWDPAGDAFVLGTLALADMTFTGASLVAACTVGVTDEVTVVVDVTAPDENAIFTVCTGDTVGAGVKTIVFGNTKITNPATFGSYIVRIITTTDGTADATVTILANDQVGVSATVVQTISFSISDITIGFGSWTGTELRYATGDTAGSTIEPGAGLPSQLTASTNAPSGLTITIRSAGDGTNAGLYKSDTPTKLITALGPNSVAAGSEGYAAYGKNATGLTIATGFTTTGTTALTTSAQTFLSTTVPVSNGTADLSLKAAIAGTTPPGSYSDAITLVCTGNF